MDYPIRKLRHDEAEILDTFLYEAIFIPKGVTAPSLAISLYKEYRNHGIGTALMKRMLLKLKEQGYKQTSLSVQKKNYAVRMYKTVGYEIVDENDEEYIMIYRL